MGGIFIYGIRLSWVQPHGGQRYQHHEKNKQRWGEPFAQFIDQSVRIEGQRERHRKEPHEERRGGNPGGPPGQRHNRRRVADNGGAGEGIERANGQVHQYGKGHAKDFPAAHGKIENVATGARNGDHRDHG